MEKTLSIEELYYELALLINKELYEENYISPSLYKNTEKELLKESSNNGPI